MAGDNFSDTERAFLESVMEKASLPDIYDARDLTMVVFRTMRDMMPAETAERTQASFKDENIEQLWKEENPIVAVLRQFRPPLKIESETFLRRVRQEGGVPKNVSAEAVVIAVFSTAREKLSPEQVKEIAEILPDGLRVMWEQI